MKLNLKNDLQVFQQQKFPLKQVQLQINKNMDHKPKNPKYNNLVRIVVDKSNAEEKKKQQKIVNRQLNQLVTNTKMNLQVNKIKIQSQYRKVILDDINDPKYTNIQTLYNDVQFNPKTKLIERNYQQNEYSLEQKQRWKSSLSFMEKIQNKMRQSSSRPRNDSLKSISLIQNNQTESNSNLKIINNAISQKPFSQIINNKLTFSEDFSELQGNSSQLIINKNKSKNKCNLVIINLWGLLAQIKSFQNQDQLQKFLNIHTNLEGSFLKLSQENHIAILLQENSINSRIINYIKKMEIDVIYLQKENQHVYIDCQQIIKFFQTDCLQKVYYFASLDQQTLCKNNQIQLEFQNKSFIDKIPIILFPNFVIIFLQNIIFDNTQTNPLKQIGKIIKGKINEQSFKQLLNMKEILQNQLELFHKNKEKNKFLEQIIEIKKNYQTKNRELFRTKNLQMTIYNEFKLEAQKRKINVFFSFIGEMFAKNQQIDQNYQLKNHKIIELINQQQFEIENYKNYFQLEESYFESIQNNILFFSEMEEKK